MTEKQVKQTGFIFKDARNFERCPRCKAQQGEYCVQPNGRKVGKPHKERVALFMVQFELGKLDLEDYTVEVVELDGFKL